MFFYAKILSKLWQGTCVLSQRRSGHYSGHPKMFCVLAANPVFSILYLAHHFNHK